MGLMINKNFNDKWIQKFINLLQGFFYAQYCPFGQEDERKIEQEICNLLKEYLELLNMGRSEDERKLVEFKNTLPVLKQLVISDMIAAYEGDPAAKSYMEIIIAYPGPLAVLVQRTAHCLYELDIPILPRVMTEYAHSRTAIDIHPGAIIGKGFFIDKDGYALGIRDELADVIKVDAFKKQMKDIIECRTMEYYRRRYVEK